MSDTDRAADNDARDGSDGRFRAPLHQCLLEAKNDYEAIAAWLATKHDPNGTGKTATHRAYRKEAERPLLWGCRTFHAIWCA